MSDSDSDSNSNSNSDADADDGGRPGDASETADELRTIGFRLRELQRLLSVRVEQENRRLEAEGIDPVTDSEFQRVDVEDETE